MGDGLAGENELYLSSHGQFIQCPIGSRFEGGVDSVHGRVGGKRSKRGRSICSECLDAALSAVKQEIRADANGDDGGAVHQCSAPGLSVNPVGLRYT